MAAGQEGAAGMGLLSRTFVSGAEATRKPWGSGRGAPLAAELGGARTGGPTPPKAGGGWPVGGRPWPSSDAPLHPPQDLEDLEEAEEPDLEEDEDHKAVKDEL